jgi:hypothetical protein
MRRIVMRKALVTVATLTLLAACSRGPKPQPIDSASLNNPPQAAAANEPPAGQPGAPAPYPNSPQQPYQGQQPYQAQQPYAAQQAPSGPASAMPAQAPAPPPPILIPAGTPVRVRLEQSVDTRRNRAGDRFEATLISPVEVDGQVILPRGTPFEGHVTQASPSGHLKGRAVLGVELDAFRLNGVSYPVVTSIDDRVSGRHRKRNWILIGGGGGLGATIGAIAGGPAGALIGAGAGAGAGTAGAYFTGKKNVAIPAETALTFRIRREVRVSGA